METAAKSASVQGKKSLEEVAALFEVNFRLTFALNGIKDSEDLNKICVESLTKV